MRAPLAIPVASISTNQNPLVQRNREDSVLHALQRAAHASPKLPKYVGVGFMIEPGRSEQQGSEKSNQG